MVDTLDTQLLSENERFQILQKQLEVEEIETQKKSRKIMQKSMLASNGDTPNAISTNVFVGQTTAHPGANSYTLINIAYADLTRGQRDVIELGSFQAWLGFALYRYTDSTVGHTYASGAKCLGITVANANTANVVQVSVAGSDDAILQKVASRVMVEKLAQDGLCDFTTFGQCTPSDGSYVYSENANGGLFRGDGTTVSGYTQILGVQRIKTQSNFPDDNILNLVPINDLYPNTANYQIGTLQFRSL